MKNTNETFFMHLRYDLDGNLVVTRESRKRKKYSNLGGFTLMVKLFEGKCQDSFYLKCAWTELKRQKPSKHNYKKLCCNFNRCLGTEYARRNYREGKNIFYLYSTQNFAEVNLHDALYRVITCFVELRKIKKII